MRSFQHYGLAILAIAVPSLAAPLPGKGSNDVLSRSDCDWSVGDWGVSNDWSVSGDWSVSNDWGVSKDLCGDDGYGHK